MIYFHQKSIHHKIKLLSDIIHGKIIQIFLSKLWISQSLNLNLCLEILFYRGILNII